MFYKFRAECLQDAISFKDKTIGLTDNFKIINQDVDSISIPDVDVEFESELSLDEIIIKMREVFDSHVMIQTLNLIERYTGERNYYL